MNFKEMYDLDDIHGVYVDDPLFSNEQEPHFPNGYPMSNHHY